MPENIIQLKNTNNSVKEFNECIRQGIPSAVFGVTDAFKNYLVSTLDQKVLYVVKDLLTARIASEQITQLTHKSVVIIPPKDEILLYSKAFSKDNTYARIAAFSGAKQADVIITTAETLMQTAPKSIDYILAEKDGELNQEETLKKLVEFGYKRVDAVDVQGTFSLRGDILDVFPVSSENPVRIDFFGDTVESIKNFDVETRANLGFIDSVKILQAHEFIFANDDLKMLKSIILNEYRKSEKSAKERLKTIIDDLEVAMENNDADRLCELLEEGKCRKEEVDGR